jgi:hypothetical protein
LVTVSPRKDWIVDELPHRQRGEYVVPFVRQHDMPRVARLTLAHGDYSRVGVEIRHGTTTSRPSSVSE